MEKLMQTPSQTAGPFFAYGLTPEQYNFDHRSIVDGTMMDASIEGERITIIGRIFDAQGTSVSDALVEFWQADRKAFGRQGTGANPLNQFTFTTIKPQNTEGVAASINIIITMRGLLSHLYTRLYFSDEEKTNAQDAVLKSVPKERRKTLVAEKKIVNGQTVYEFNIYLQGELETVFFDV
jgi:protocatechuate 3,4-dioxygenase, alpha subunit